MGIIKAFSGAIGGTFADQWKDIIIAGPFNEHSVVVPGRLRSTNNGRGANLHGSEGVLTNGSMIYVPENMAAFIFSQSGIEDIITQSGGYEYQNGQESFFSDGSISSIANQTLSRIPFGGISPDYKQIAFVNLREIRNIKFGTRGAQVYFDCFYGVDLEIMAYGSFSIKVFDPVKFIMNFVPPNTLQYSFDDPKVRAQLISEFLLSFITALNSLSGTYRISQLPSQANAIARTVAKDPQNAGTWGERFGFQITSVAVENIELTEESRELIQQYASNKMSVKAYEDISQKASNIAAQQKIAQGIQDNGFGNAGGMIMGMNVAQGLGTNMQQIQTMSFNEQVEALKKLKELLDMGILTQEEFEIKKEEIMGV